MTVPRPRQLPMEDTAGSEGKPADQNPRRHQNRAGGDDGRKRLIERFYNGLLWTQGLLELGITVGDDDGIVDVGAHLDSADNQVAEEKEV